METVNHVKWRGIILGSIVGIAGALGLHQIEKSDESSTPEGKGISQTNAPATRGSSASSIAEVIWRRGQKMDGLAKAPVEYANLSIAAGVEAGISVDELMRAIETQAKGDPLQMFRAAQSLQRSGLRDEIMLLMFQRFQTESPELALKFSAFLPPDKRDRLTQDFLANWVERGGPGVFKRLLESREAPLRLLSGALKKAASIDPEGMLNYIQNAPAEIFTGAGPRAGRAAYIRAVLGALPPEKSISLMKTLPPSREVDQTLSAQYAVLLKTKPETIRELAGNLQDPKVLQAYRSALTFYANNDPAIALEIAALLPSERSRGTAFEEAARVRIASNPEEIVPWLVSLPDPLGRLSATRSAVGALIKQDPMNALSRVASIESSSVQKAWSNALVTQLPEFLAKATDADLAKAANVTDPHQKELLRQAVFRLPPDQAKRVSGFLR